MERLYRFRNTHALLDGFHELENQEIYFADFESLNDPMEGYRRFVWKGDRLLWRNLLEHYLYCVFHAYCEIQTHLGMEGYTLSAKDIAISYNQEDLNDQSRNIFNPIKYQFFAVAGMDELLEILEEYQEITEAELLFFLDLVHKNAIQLVDNYFSEVQNMPLQFVIEPIRLVIEQRELFKLDAQRKERELGAIADQVRKNEQAKAQYKSYKEEQEIIITFSPLLFHFSRLYLDSVKNLAYPPVYLACFMEDYTNSASWGYYADNHKGVCLIFEPIEGKKGAGLLIRSNPNYQYAAYELNKVNYSGEYREVEFFSSIGRLGTSQLISQWFTDEQGTMSIHAQHILNPTAKKEWGKRVWDDFLLGHTIKFEAWAHEKEQRIILIDYLNHYAQIIERKFEYDFNQLKGLIFGIRTTSEQRMKIINIIEQLCKKHGRTEFEFYEAKSSHESTKIEKIRLSIDLFAANDYSRGSINNHEKEKG